MEYVRKLDEIEARFEGLTRQLADPAVISDPEQYRKVAKGHRDLDEVVAAYRRWKQLRRDLDGARPMLEEADEDLRAMAAEEVQRLEPELASLEERLKVLLLPRDPND